jgi:hypothetical protein
VTQYKTHFSFTQKITKNISFHFILVMRIRKNAKLSPLLYTCSSSLLKNGSFPVETFQTHFCQLNQSPWDVIPFHSPNFNNSSIQVLLFFFSDLLGFFHFHSFRVLIHFTQHNIFPLFIFFFPFFFKLG